MKIFQLLALSLEIMMSDISEAWWEVYDRFEETILEKPIEYRRKTYGREFWPYFKNAGLRIGDLAIMPDGREALVIGAKKGPSCAPIQFRYVGGANETALFNETHLRPGMVKVLRHLPFYAAIRLSLQLEKEAVAGMAPSKNI